MWHKAFRKASVAGGFSRFLSFLVLKYHQKYHQPEHVRWSTHTAPRYRQRAATRPLVAALVLATASLAGVMSINLSPLTTGPASATSSTGRFCTGQGTGIHVGCFGSTVCRPIIENGSAAGPLITDLPASATLASVFCPATGVGFLNGFADLPGPDAVALPGTFLTHN